MTKVPEMTIAEIKRKLERLKELGWVRSYRKGPTGVGHTMEGLLGLGETNISLPDWGKLEIKTIRRNSNTPITLFSKSPKLKDCSSLKEFVEKHGYWDEKRERQALYCSLTSQMIETGRCKGWIMRVDKESEDILFQHFKEVVAVQDALSLKKKMAEKLSNLVLIIADRKRERNAEFFQYNEAYLLANAAHDHFLDLIENGDIIFDWRLYLRPNGTVRDHGAAYRIKESKLVNLYAHRERLV